MWLQKNLCIFTLNETLNVMVLGSWTHGYEFWRCLWIVLFCIFHNLVFWVLYPVLFSLLFMVFCLRSWGLCWSRFCSFSCLIASVDNTFLITPLGFPILSPQSCLCVITCLILIVICLMWVWFYYPVFLVFIFPWINTLFQFFHLWDNELPVFFLYF